MGHCVLYIDYQNGPTAHQTKGKSQMDITHNKCNIKHTRTHWESIWTVTDQQGNTTKYKNLRSKGTFGHGIKAYAHMDTIAPGWRELDFSPA